MKKLIYVLAFLTTVATFSQVETDKFYNYTIVGDKIKLTEVVTPHQTDTYIFDKVEWGIVEGVVSKEVALNNRVKINEAITYANNNNFSIFHINNIDAYFEVGALHFGNLTNT